jgi:hypothetical protein
MVEGAVAAGDEPASVRKLGRRLVVQGQREVDGVGAAAAVGHDDGVLPARTDEQDVQVIWERVIDPAQDEVHVGDRLG